MMIFTGNAASPKWYRVFDTAPSFAIEPIAAQSGSAVTSTALLTRSRGGQTGA